MEHPPIATERALTRAEVLALGLTPWRLRRAVAEGRLVRLRRDRYVNVADPHTDAAIAMGARLTCVSLLVMLGVFVRSADLLHLHIPPNSSRHRKPVANPRMRLHWTRLFDTPPSRHAVALVDAVRCAILCQPPRDAIATLDSLLHLGLMRLHEVRDVFSTLPARYGALLPLVDGRAESGPETLVRLMLRQLGANVELQVLIPEVGRVDLVVNRWLVIECDSKAHHEGWDKQRDDRRRDLAAVRLGYVCIRLLAEDVLYSPERVYELLAAILAQGPLLAR
ncbi:type IV toxin-antitoxin system AbiEi family antitoxin domain-containing protein [uncultured Microbacterium sp.]|uniref:type IV toxin-antitoxin system AbiEi family antitoxin domain-containing protein n=1 Tax=uncultured Microbacterium sp. TaxID=191216 RepID=UPI00260F98D0|nr:type IV toxin-antitoxin system AbiEi family antitoxin domain-containing protein [uncultured Microbacterium sp.]